MLKKLISITMILCLLFVNVLAASEVKKDETIYVNLKSDGTVAKIKVVNHIYGSDNASHFTDYGNYSNVKNMTGKETPEISGDAIKWPMELLRKGDIYYEGTIDKELPVALKIKYFLDGKEISPKDLGGKSGHLRIDIEITHSNAVDWDKAKLLTQIQLTADLDVFKEIKTAGSRVVVGKKANITFVAMPPGNQSFRFEAEGENIYLDPISITVVPSTISLSGDMKSGLEQLTDGLNKMGDGTSELAEGAKALTSGTGELKAGMAQLDKGVGSLYKGSKELSKNTHSLKSGIDQYYDGLKQMAGQGDQLISGFGQLSTGMETLGQKGNEIQQGLGQINEGLKAVDKGNAELSQGLDQLAAGHTQLMQLASMYANSNDPMLRKLAEGVIQEGEGLQKLNAGLKESSKGLGTIAGSTNQLYQGYGEYNTGIVTMAGSMKQMSQGVGALPAAMKQLVKGFEALKTGLDRYFGGVVEISKALGLLRENTKSLPQNTDKLLKGQTQLKDGIVSVDKGLAEMSQEINSSLGGLTAGDQKNSYQSFADNEKNKNSTVQFVMRTAAIERPEKAKADFKPVEEKKSFVDRILALFKKK